WDAASGAFSANHNGSASKITNLAAGTLAADSTDAVNGSQLFDTNEKVDQNTADKKTTKKKKKKKKKQHLVEF
ncbi:Peptide transport system permease protein sapB, partial [Salmonella enterica subsp. enterica serovar Newport str. SHSN007]|uniref:hypothetical protein n=1 Tax=Salmonella enterica TaxID=28901 RepID=UPI000A183B9F